MGEPKHVRALPSELKCIAFVGVWLSSGSPSWRWWQRTCLPLKETWETQVWSLGWEDLWEEGMAAHSVSLPGESRGQRRMAGYSHGVSKSRTRLKRLSSDVAQSHLLLCCGCTWFSASLWHGEAAAGVLVRLAVRALWLQDRVLLPETWGASVVSQALSAPDPAPGCGVGWVGLECSLGWETGCSMLSPVVLQWWLRPLPPYSGHTPDPKPPLCLSQDLSGPGPTPSCGVEWVGGAAVFALLAVWHGGSLPVQSSLCSDCWQASTHARFTSSLASPALRPCSSPSSQRRLSPLCRIPDWATQSVTWPALSPGWGSIHADLLFLSDPSQGWRSWPYAFCLSYLVRWKSFLQLWLYSSSVSF